LYGIKNRQRATQQHIMIEDKSNKLRKIQAFESRELQLDEFKPEIISRCDEYFMFVLSATKYIDNKKTQTYFFLRKRVSVVQELISESMQSEKKALGRRHSLFQDQTEIIVVAPSDDPVSLPQFKKIKFGELNEYMQKEEKSNIRLTFEKFNDINHCVPFILFVYSNNLDAASNKLVCYDIVKEVIMQSVQINPKRKSYLYRDETGFNCWKIVRTSDKAIYRNVDALESDYAYCYEFSLFVLFGPNLGRIHVQDFHMRYNWTARTLSETND
jgi:hypothetical protein